jgi:PPK2 family polyphosphate:nucleotide phosphotransferase
VIESPYLAEPGKKLSLSKFDPADTGKFKDRSDAAQSTARNLDRLRKLQGLLYADAKQALLIVVQAMDTGGKDGAIKHVFSGVNPQGCDVTSFKQPTPLEAKHDYLWRIHAAAPRQGQIGIFNRSHYEDVLVVRVHDLVPKSVWSQRYDQINQFEHLLADAGTTVVKFFLHISKDEQKRRLQSRLDNPKKHWKFDPNDLKERARWDEYQSAYEDALRKCSTPHAPWYVVPSNHKWFRNWVISDTIVRTMRGMKLKYPPAPEGMDQIKVDD